jgi:hypothetical protein
VLAMGSTLVRTSLVPHLILSTRLDAIVACGLWTPHRSSTHANDSDPHQHRTSFRILDPPMFVALPPYTRVFEL